MSALFPTDVDSVPVQHVDDMVDQTRGALLVGWQPGAVRVAVTRTGDDQRPLGHLSVTPEEGPKLCAALAAVLASRDRHFEERFTKHFEAAMKRVEG